MMINESTTNRSPHLLIEDRELVHSFYSFCTFCFLYYINNNAAMIGEIPDIFDRLMRRLKEII